MDEPNEQFECPEISGTQVGWFQKGNYPVRLTTARGSVECRYYPSTGSTLGVLWVGGAGGGWDSPGRGILPIKPGLYPRLAESLVSSGISSLRVRYRQRAVLDESSHDLRAGLSYLQTQGITTFALVGWSFGGAVALRVAAAEPGVKTVVTLASSSNSIEVVPQLSPRCSILLIHGGKDRTLPPSSSERLFAVAGEPKRLLVLPGADHGLNQVAGQVEQLLRDWLVERLAPD